MSGSDLGRRAAVQRFAALALAPFAALGRPAAAGDTLRTVALPTGNFRLERTLTRGLGDGARIVVTRQWRIAFAPVTTGIAVTGEQIYVAIDSPPRLAALSEIERTRSTAAMFPILLDPTGLIRRGNGQGDDAAWRRALDTGRTMIESLTMTDADRQDARSFLAKLANLSAGAVSQLPEDLFFPRTGSETTTRELPLPDGGRGLIMVNAIARAAPSTGLLEVTERRIVTRVAESERSTVERWAMAKL